MNPITTFNGWLISKLINYLTAKEGFLNEETQYTATGIKTIVRDAFGYRYEIHVKTLSRLQANNEDFNENFLTKTSLMGSPKNEDISCERNRVD